MSAEYLIRKRVAQRFYYYLVGSTDKNGRCSYQWSGLRNYAMVIGDDNKGWMTKQVQEQNMDSPVDYIRK